MKTRKKRAKNKSPYVKVILSDLQSIFKPDAKILVGSCYSELLHSVAPNAEDTLREDEDEMAYPVNIDDSKKTV